VGAVHVVGGLLPQQEVVFPRCHFEVFGFFQLLDRFF